MSSRRSAGQERAGRKGKGQKPLVVQSWAGTSASCHAKTQSVREETLFYQLESQGCAQPRLLISLDICLNLEHLVAQTG